MTEQLDMFGGAAALEKPALTERQVFALDEISKADGGLASDELGAALHERRGSHERGVRCHFCSSEGREVGRRLKALGFVVLKRGGMWQSVSSGSASEGAVAARQSDPSTSHHAAASVRDLTGKQQAVLECFRKHGPMTDEQLCEAYPRGDVPVQSVSGLRTRRHELVEKGALRDSGRKGTTEAGRASIIWELADGIPF